ncbi:TPA: hypothetical protein P2Q98_001942 [Aeromonas veronii]|uniref:hypothetical protein n=1 Tax=Aeromonas veronii TaxID=654 RepID=UPI003312B00C|nr:hypothetical protein [Aeromonas veronii]HDO1333782.1 hypothetical protein [Aeromonas veronii]HDO1337476.1 hypothetical protein [Aeromonas veronii]HDO1342858.1 hypothetical protein [Aeromonas veronii]HDO1347197.1 hypothetical protein [Aeromonas veronii]
MTEHTKGLLALFRNGQSVGSVDGYGVCELWPRSDEGFPNCEGKENGRRIVACWNLLDGYATEELEGVTLAEFVASHPELAEKALIAAYASLFAERGATNYLEVKGARPELGPFTITLQRNEGLTPVEKLEAMTKQRDALSSALEWTDEQIMEFISMAFRHAQIKGDFELSDVRDALNMIKARALGGKVCEGCGNTGGGKCPDCGPVIGNETYQEMFGKGEQS